MIALLANAGHAGGTGWPEAAMFIAGLTLLAFLVWLASR